MARLSEIDFFRSVLDNLHVAVYVVDREGKILFWNDGAERITGYLRQDVIGRLYTDNFLGETDGDDNELTDALAPTTTAMREGRPTQALVSMRHKSGHRIPVQLWAFPVRNSDGVIVGAAESFEESIALAEWDRRQTKLASYGCIDEASGVLNHGVMQSHIGENIRLFEEHHVPFSILCMEMDHLDKVQSRDGPGAIAVILRVVGQTLESTVRPTDFLGRWQSNQFLAILTECSGTKSSALPSASAAWLTHQESRGGAIALPSPFPSAAPSSNTATPSKPWFYAPRVRSAKASPKAAIAPRCAMTEMPARKSEIVAPSPFPNSQRIDSSCL